MALFRQKPMPYQAARDAQGDFSDILKTLSLDSYYPSKLSLWQVMAIKKATGQLKLTDIPWMMIHKLLMIDYHARDQLLSEVSISSKETCPDASGDFDMEALLKMHTKGGVLNKQTSLNTLDVLVAIFTCCDNILKQTLAQKLFVCKLAIPFIYPIGLKNKVCMSLWALRTIAVQWYNNHSAAKEVPVTEEPFPLVTFVRLGRPPLSKSKLMNNILQDESHNTFFNHDCNNGNVERRIANGLVECAWFIASNKCKEHLPRTTMLLNLRGDASLMTTQMQILQKISTVVFVIATAKDLAIPPNTQTCKQILKTDAKVILFLMSRNNQQMAIELQTCFAEIGTNLLKGVPIISSSTQEGVQKTASEIRTEARGKLSVAIAKCSGIKLEECAQRASKLRVIIDEYDDEACLKGKRLADKVISHMKGKDIAQCKRLLLPLQGDQWIEYCRMKRVQQKKVGMGSSANQAERVDQNLVRFRTDQRKTYNSNSTTFIKEFMIHLNESDTVVIYFLKWITFCLDGKSRAILPDLRSQYHEKWTRYHEATSKPEKHMDKMKEEVNKAEKKLVSASLGLENLFRELGQIYEAMNGKNVRQLPEMAAKLLLNGIPLELVDGDASGIPIVWVSAVLETLGNIIGEKRLFVLSVLGIQSSGKSTLLNTMFGLQFAVRAGRCTRGAYMQLIPVDKHADLPFHYVVVIDTEGLRAPELAQQKYDHDNELATLVIGLGDATIINIKGENAGEMKDVLQIVVHAFLRMNLVSKHIQDHRTCIFVHQNVPAVNAKELMRHGCQKLQEMLDYVAKEAAIGEQRANIQSFSQIINFDVRKHVWYFSDLWYGNPPMAPANPGYSEKVEEVRLQVLEEIAKRQKSFLTPSDLSLRVSDLWKGVLADNFVFNFRNSLEVKAYNNLQSKYYSLEWAMQKDMKSWLQNAERKLKICESIDCLNKTHESLKDDLSKVLREKAVEMRTSLEAYFEDCNQHEIIIQWKDSQLIQVNFAVNQQKLEGSSDLLSKKEARRLEILQLQKWSSHEAYIMNKAVELADQLKGKQATDAALKNMFDKMWVSMMNELAVKTGDTELNMVHEMKEVLYKRFHDQEQSLSHELDSNPLCNPREQKPLKVSITIDDIKPEHISLNSTVQGNTRDMIVAKIKTVELTESILEEISYKLDPLSTQDTNSQKLIAKEVIEKLLQKIDQHNENAYASKCNFTILPRYAVKVAVHVSRRCVEVFNSMQLNYNRKHGIEGKLEKYRISAWESFKVMVQRSTEEVKAGDLLCKLLTGIVQKTVKKALPLECIGEVLRDFQMTKNYLMVKMLDDLAVKENFEEYKSYINNAKEFALKWIKQYTNEKMFSRKEEDNLSRYAEIAQSHIRRIMQCIERSVKLATTTATIGKSMTLWTKRFSQSVSEEIAVPVSTMTYVSAQSVVNFNNLERIILEGLERIKTNLEKEFKDETKESVEWDGTPPSQQILDKIWGCADHCPFCKEPCADNTPNHYSLLGKSHICVQHRPKGIAGIFWEKDGAVGDVKHVKKQLLHETCNYDVQRDNVTFKCSACSFRCRDSKECSTTANEYVHHNNTEYKTYLPEWDIAPDSTNSVSKYWMWFMVTYRDELTDMYNAQPPDIPKSWRSIKKEEALTDLRKIHH